MRRAGAVLALLAAIAVAALCVRLGLWQLARWQEKRERVAARSEQLNEPVSEVADAWLLHDDLIGRRVRVRGVFEDTCHVLVAGRIEQGEPGVGLVSVFALANGGRLLVDRGWIPASDARDADPRRFDEPGSRELTGVLDTLPRAPAAAQWLRLPEAGPGRWSVGRLTLAGARLRLGADLAPFRLTELPSEGAAALPRRVPPPVEDAGMHLSYALQWFLFAVATLAGAVFVMARGRPAAKRPPQRSR